MSSLVFETLDEFLEELEINLIGLGGSFDLLNNYEDGTKFFSHNPTFKLHQDKLECPWVPSSLDIVTLFYATLDSKPETLCEIGFGNGQNLWMLNSILDYDRLIGYEPNPLLFDWVKKVALKKFKKHTLLSQDTEALTFVEDLGYQGVILINDIFQTNKDIPKNTQYFLWMNQDLTPKIISQIPSGSEVAIYRQSRVEDNIHVFDSLPLKKLDHQVGIENDDYYEFIQLYEKI